MIDAGTGEVKLLALLQLPAVHVIELMSSKVAVADIAVNVANGNQTDLDELCLNMEAGRRTLLP